MQKQICRLHNRYISLEYSHQTNCFTLSIVQFQSWWATYRAQANREAVTMAPNSHYSLKATRSLYITGSLSIDIFSQPSHANGSNFFNFVSNLTKMLPLYTCTSTLKYNVLEKNFFLLKYIDFGSENKPNIFVLKIKVFCS